MVDIRFAHEWMSAGTDERVIRETSAQLAIYLGDTCLTRNEDIWSKTVRDSVLVSTYPLALWLAASWWRLHFEPLPLPGLGPSHDWRMAHELGAANHGFVWPRVIFASDGEVVNVWAESLKIQGQSIQYLNGLDGPQTVKVADFQRSIDQLIAAVLSRLSAVGCQDNDLAGLWAVVQGDRADPQIARMRRLEAQLGFDPEECPPNVMEQALLLQDEMGDAAMSELAPVYGRPDEGGALEELAGLGAIEGMRGAPQIRPSTLAPHRNGIAPWRQGAQAAKLVRAQIGNVDEPLSNSVLFGLLGLTVEQVDQWVTPSSKLSVAVATPFGGGRLNYVLRKRHPHAKRFELSRFLGDYLREPETTQCWLASTDLSTARQKYQRAFAAELLCPVDAVVNFLDGDLSESALDEAAEYFEVGEITVRSLLSNNGFLPSAEPRIPYPLAA